MVQITTQSENTKERCVVNASCYSCQWVYLLIHGINHPPRNLQSMTPMSGGMEPSAVCSLAPVPVPSRQGSECMADNPRLLQGGPLICSVSPLIQVSTKGVREVFLVFRAPARMLLWGYDSIYLKENKK